VLAEDLVNVAREETASVAARLRGHPYLEAVELGRLPREALGRFAGEQWHIISSDLRSVAHLVARSGAPPVREFFLDVLNGERAALRALISLGRAVGMSEAELHGYEPLPGAHAYTCYMAWLALYGSPGQVAAAYLVNFPAWGENCGLMSAALQSRYAMHPDDVAFFDLFATPAADFESRSLKVIQADLDAGMEPSLIRRCVRLLQAYELMFWDTLHEASA
jgi:pyrroloquinoline quinone (PQQ) biosynthesis protein C